jgi:hypothetical protein
MNRLPAFTLMETIMALLLTAILGVMATLVLQHLLQGAAGFRQRHLDEAELVELHGAIRADHARSLSMVPGNGSGIQFICPMDTVFYDILPDSTVQRSGNGHLQVFHVKATGQEHMLEPNTELVSCWQLRLDVQGDQRTVVLYQPYLIADRLAKPETHGHTYPR